MQTNPTKFFIYVRKSSEDIKRQVLSIEAQKYELRNLALQQGLQIVDEFEESRTAKVPGRAVFNSMMARIAKGEADGILCWKLDRLARNLVDAGQLINQL